MFVRRPGRERTDRAYYWSCVVRFGLITAFSAGLLLALVRWGFPVAAETTPMVVAICVMPVTSLGVAVAAALRAVGRDAGTGAVIAVSFWGWVAGAAGVIGTGPVRSADLAISAPLTLLALLVMLLAMPPWLRWRRLPSPAVR